MPPLDSEQKEKIAAAKNFTTRWISHFSQTCPELGMIPPGWAFISDKDSKRIYWVNIKNGDVTDVNPHLGPLPDGWVLRVVKEMEYPDGTEGMYKVRYHDRRTGVWTRDNPRVFSNHLRQQSGEISKDMRISASTTRNKGFDLRELHRQPIGSRDIRGRYECVHTIDDGEGGIGGMNGGVYVVRMKGVPAKLYVEKHFKSDLMEPAKQEIKMIHRVRHSSLTMFTAAFITETTASIYLEFCDRGSLGDMMKVYQNHPNELIPEPFIWHAFIGLADALAYLQTGGPGARNWIPILHRDVKPDNVLLRSRSTIGSTKYPYCILSDFGLAEEDIPDPKKNPALYFEGKCGSKMWWAPEMLYAPYPKNRDYEKVRDIERHVFPRGCGFTSRSDVWALGAVAFNMAKVDFERMPIAHLLWPQPYEYKNVDGNVYLEGTVSRKNNLVLPKQYSRFLCEAVAVAMTKNVRDRPDALALLGILKGLLMKAGWGSQQSATDCPLPEWSSRIHSYHG